MGVSYEMCLPMGGVLMVGATHGECLLMGCVRLW